jgi:hypothetical protein
MAFMFKLVLEDGTPADPPVLDIAVPNWRSGDVITLGRAGPCAVIDFRQDSEDEPVRVVETD